jgi:hypothetical protein
MKLAELEIGAEYAMGVYGRAFSRWTEESTHVRLVGFAHVPSQPRQAKVVLLEDMDRYGQGYPRGDSYNCRLVALWWPWAEELRRRSEAAQLQARREELAGVIRDALTRLGLHGERGLTGLNSLEGSEVVVSGAELVKLADRADHLIELERLMRAWHANKLGDGALAPDRAFLISFESKLTKWAGAHDFSMLESS